MSIDSINEREGLERLESLVKDKNFKEASSFAADLREKFPSSYQIGFLYYRILVSLERYSESENILDKLLKLYPENINLLLEKGELLIGREKVAESKLFFDKVLFLDPFNSKAKEGISRAKKSVSGSPIGFEKYERDKAALEDTMKEADLERFMKESDNQDPELLGEAEDELDISISETDIEFREPLEDKKDIQDDTGILPDMAKVHGKVESALEELDKFSKSDIGDLGLENRSDKIEEKSEVIDNEVKKEDTFDTESAAMLYLKQGLYNDAREVYAKLYEGTDGNLFIEKIEKVKRIEKANLKIIALEGFLEKIKVGSVRIV